MMWFFIYSLDFAFQTSWAQEEKRDDQILVSDDAMTVFDDYECHPCDIPLRQRTEESEQNRPGTV